MNNITPELSYNLQHSYVRKMRVDAATEPFYLALNPCITYAPEQIFNGIQPYVSYSPNPLGSGLQPAVYTGVEDECLSWHNNCYIHSNLNPTPTGRVTGLDVLKFLSKYCTNSFEKFPVGKIKHAVMCDETGRLMADGILIRTGEQEYHTYWLNQWMQYCAETSGLDVKSEDLTGKVFLFQLGGPRALEIVEAATGENLHDIGFLESRKSKINGAEVLIARIGMAGTLAYEVHGDFEDSREVYSKLIAAGEKYGLRKLGLFAYNITHTENGFPQSGLDFPYAWSENKEFLEWLGERQISHLHNKQLGFMCRGSLGQGFEPRYRNPFDLGWDPTVRFDHEFIGKEALQAIANDPNHKVFVVLEWNTDDVLDIIRSQYEPGEAYKRMGEWDDYSSVEDGIYHNDIVFSVDGSEIGISSGRIHSAFYRTVISNCSISPAYSKEGTEVFVLWGDPGTRQKKVRAIVKAHPYRSTDRNDKVDISKIPYGFK